MRFCNKEYKSIDILHLIALIWISMQNLTERLQLKFESKRQYVHEYWFPK